MATIDAPAPGGLSVPGEGLRRGVPRRRSVRIRGREYPVLLPSIRDPRLHVAAVLLTLQVLGQTVLDFRLSVAQILACLVTGALIEFGVAFFKDKTIMWPASGLLTGNSTAFILRVPGTIHGQWWSKHGIYIFIGVVAFAMATKYLIRWKGRHIFNPSNIALVLAFVVLGPQYTEPQDLWWIPMGMWMIVTYAVLIGGGLLIAWELKLLGLVAGYMAAFTASAAIALAPVPDHCMVASWHATALCGTDLWKILVTSPELPDGLAPKLALVVGSGPDYTSWLTLTAGTALPSGSQSGPVSASARVWVLPPIPPVSVPSNVPAFDPSVNQQTADKWAHDAVLDLLIESEARRAHDLKLAE